MAYEVTVVARFVRPPDEDELRRLLEGAYDDCDVLDVEEEEV